MSNVMTNFGDIPINKDNEALILVNAIKNEKNRETFLRRVDYRQFRLPEFQMLAWAIKQCHESEMVMDIDALLLKAKSSPVRKTLTYKFVETVMEGFQEVTETNFNEHVEDLNLDSVRVNIMDLIFNSLYKSLMDPTKKLSDIERRVDLLKQMIEDNYSSYKCEFQSMEESVIQYQEDLVSFGKRTCGFRQLDEKLTEGLQGGQITVICGLPGMGKSIKKDTPILMYDGIIKLAEDIQVGDKLMGVDSKPREILFVSIGVGQLYKIKQIKGDDYVVNGPHVLALRRSKNQYFKSDKKLPKDQRRCSRFKGELLEIEVEDYVKKSEGWKAQYKGYKVDGWDLEERNITIDPYWLGLWLGDGSIDNTGITNPDKEILQYIKKYADKLGMLYTLRGGVDRCTMGVIVKNNTLNNYLLDELRNYNLLNNTKFVPNDFKYNTREIRFQVLAGLLDSDGYLTTGTFEIITKYDQLKDDILYLARSLGFYAVAKYEKKGIKSINFEGMYWRLRISGHVNRIPTKVKRKQSAPRKQIKNVLNTGIEVESLDVGEYVSITLSPESDQLFILGDGTVTHNSSFVLSMMKNLSHKGIFTAQFALEMPNRSIINKLMAYSTDFAVSKIATHWGKLTGKEKERYEYELKLLKENQFMLLNDKPRQTLGSINEQVILLQDKLQTQYIVIVVDLFGKISDLQSSDNFARSYEQKLNEAQVMTRNLGINLVPVAQINREVVKRKFNRPKMSDLKNAGAWEEVADLMFGVHRPYYDPEIAMKIAATYGTDTVVVEEEDPNKDLAEIIIMKQRMGIANDITNFRFHPDTTKMSPVDAEYQEMLNASKEDCYD